jgi:hypothetical protein
VPFVLWRKGRLPSRCLVDLQKKFDWVLEPVVCPSVDRLIEVLEEKIVEPAKAKFDQLLARRTKELRIENV